MGNHKEKGVLNNNDIVNDLIRLPKKNLEARINQLETDIIGRQKISNSIITSLSTHQIQLKDRLRRQQYFPLINGHNIRNQTTSKIIQIEEDILREIVANFKDITELRKELLYAKDEISLLKQKLKILESV